MEIWSESVIIEKEEGWFIGAQCNALFHIDFRTKKYKPLSLLPSDDLFGYEIYECCNKIKEAIYIFPRHTAGNILEVSLTGQLIQEIAIENPKKVDVNVVGTCVYGEKIYAMSVGLHKIIVLDLRSNTVTDACDIFEDVEIIDINGKMVLKEDNIYCIIPDSNMIYKFNLSKCVLKKYIIKEIEQGIHSFGSVEDRFWLTGKSKCIYLWNELENSIVRMDNFPRDFGVYKFNWHKQLFLDTDTQFYPEGFFVKGIYINGIVWLIPASENKILYFDMNTVIIKELELLDEIENEYTWDKNQLKVKFCMCYVRQDRYIGVYSFKNKYIFEIDTQSLAIEIKQFIISEKDVYYLYDEKVKNDLENKSLLLETKEINLRIYLRNFDINSVCFCENSNIGSSIQKYFCNSNRNI